MRIKKNKNQQQKKLEQIWKLQEKRKFAAAKKEDGK